MVEQENIKEVAKFFLDSEPIRRNLLTLEGGKDFDDAIKFIESTAPYCLIGEVEGIFDKNELLWWKDSWEMYHYRPNRGFRGIFDGTVQFILDNDITSIPILREVAAEMRNGSLME